MIPPPADRSGKTTVREGRCVRGGGEKMPSEICFIRRAFRPLAGPQQVVG